MENKNQNAEHCCNCKFIFFPTQTGLSKYYLCDILYFEGAGNQAIIIFKGMLPRAVINLGLNAVADLVEKDGFMRCHNSFIVNGRHVNDYRKGRGGYAALDNGLSVKVGREYAEAFKAWLAKRKNNPADNGQGESKVE